MIRRWRARRLLRAAIKRASSRVTWGAVFTIGGALIQDPALSHYLAQFEYAQRSELLLRYRLHRLERPRR